MVAGGDALGRADDGRVALIDGALPGERVRIEVTANRADHLRGRVLELLRDGHFGRAREVTLRVGVGSGERAALADPAETILDLPTDVARGKTAHVHELIDGHSLRVSINSFFQSRTDGAEALVRLVREAAGRDRVLADLYCGVGLFAITADDPRRLIAVARGRAAVSDAKHN